MRILGNNDTKLFLVNRINTPKGTEPINVTERAIVYEEETKKMKRRFYDLVDWTVKEIAYCESRIFIDFNTDLFKFDLGLKPSKTLQPA